MIPSPKKKIAEFANAAAVEHETLLLRYLRRRLRRPEDLNDLAQEVYLRLLKMNDESQVTHIRNPMAYVYVVARRVLSDWHAAQDRRIEEHGVSIEEVQGEVAASAGTSNDSLSDPADRLARQQHIERVLGQLPPIQKAALLYRMRDGLPLEEVAKKLNLSYRMARHHVAQAMASIRVKSWDR